MKTLISEEEKLRIRSLYKGFLFEQSTPEDESEQTWNQLWSARNPEDTKVYNDTKKSIESQGFKPSYAGELNTPASQGMNWEKNVPIEGLNPTTTTYFAKTISGPLVGIYDNVGGKSSDTNIRFVIPDLISARGGEYDGNLNQNERYFVEDNKWYVNFENPLDMIYSKQIGVTPQRKLGTELQPKQPKMKQ